MEGTAQFRGCPVVCVAPAESGMEELIIRPTVSCTVQCFSPVRSGFVHGRYNNRRSRPMRMDVFLAPVEFMITQMIIRWETAGHDPFVHFFNINHKYTKPHLQSDCRPTTFRYRDTHSRNIHHFTYLGIYTITAAEKSFGSSMITSALDIHCLRSEEVELPDYTADWTRYYTWVVTVFCSTSKPR